jgi:hypothetical protein
MRVSAIRVSPLIVIFAIIPSLSSTVTATRDQTPTACPTNTAPPTAVPVSSSSFAPPTNSALRGPLPHQPLHQLHDGQSSILDAFDLSLGRCSFSGPGPRSSRLRIIAALSLNIRHVGISFPSQKQSTLCGSCRQSTYRHPPDLFRDSTPETGGTFPHSTIATTSWHIRHPFVFSACSEPLRINHPLLSSVRIGVSSVAIPSVTRTQHRVWSRIHCPTGQALRCAREFATLLP